jgi:hypothetical protein
MTSPFVTVKVPRAVFVSVGIAFVAWFMTLPAIYRNGSIGIQLASVAVLLMACQGLSWAVTEGESRRARYIIALSILASLALQLRLR